MISEVVYCRPMYSFRSNELLAIEDLYQQGNSAQEIKDLLQLRQTTRSIQRYVKKVGVSRSVGDAFRLAVSKGRVDYSHHHSVAKKQRVRLKLGLRYQLLQQANFTCQLCGAKAPEAPLEIDHKDSNPANNNLNNLQVICNSCNKGKDLFS